MNDTFNWTFSGVTNVADTSSASGTVLLKNPDSRLFKKVQMRGAPEIGERRRPSAVRRSEAIERSDRLCENASEPFDKSSGRTYKYLNLLIRPPFVVS